MDISDDITYAVHDLTDFIAAGKIPIESLAAVEQTAERNAFYEDVFRRHPEWSGEREQLIKRMNLLFELFVFDRRYNGDLADQQALSRLTSVLISRFINEIRLEDDPAESVRVFLPKEFEREIRILKELMWTYVILGNDLLTEQYGQRITVRETLEIMLSAATSDEERRLFPPSFQDMLAAAETDLLRKRIAVDYVAGMTERELAKKHRLLKRS